MTKFVVIISLNTLNTRKRCFDTIELTQMLHEITQRKTMNEQEKQQRLMKRMKTT